MPVPYPDGHALLLDGTVRSAITQGTSTRTAFFFAPTGVSGTVASAWSLTPGIPGGTILLTGYTIPLLKDADDAGGATTGRVSTGYAEVACTTQMLNRGGRVYVTSFDGRLALPAAPSALTNAQAGTVLDGIVAFPQTRIYDASDFANPKKFNTWIVNTIEYQSFQPWVGTQTPEAHASHFAIWSGSQPYHRPMATVCVIVEVPAIQQTFEMSFHAKHYTRWPITSVPGQAMVPLKTADQKVITDMHKTLEEHGRNPDRGGAM